MKAAVSRLLMKPIALAWVLLAGASLASAAELDRIRGIYSAGDRSEPATLAANAIRAYVQYVNKRQTVPELDKAPAPEQGAIIIGKAALDLGLISPEEVRQAAPDGFVIKVTADQVAMAGAEPWALTSAAGRFAELLGLRHGQSPPDHGVPLARSDQGGSIAPQTIIDKPAFCFRNGRNFMLGQVGVQVADAHYGADPELFDAKKTGSDLWLDHTAGYLVPRLKYYDEHPEYYAMGKDGKRIAKQSFSDHRTALCLSNPDVKRISTERALIWVDKNPDKKSFFVTHGDTNLWCCCPECSKLDEMPGHYAARLLQWVNHVADAVGKKYPDKVLLTLAYAGSNQAPKKIKPAGNVRVIYATGMGNRPFYGHENMQTESYEVEKAIIGQWA